MQYLSTVTDLFHSALVLFIKENVALTFSFTSSKHGFRNGKPQDCNNIHIIVYSFEGVHFLISWTSHRLLFSQDYVEKDW